MNELVTQAEIDQLLGPSLGHRSGTATKLAGGIENDVLLVPIQEQKYVIRVSRIRTSRQVRAEFDLLRSLPESFRCVQPVLFFSGKSPVVVFQYVPGCHRRRDEITPKHCYRIGQRLANLHRVTRGRAFRRYWDVSQTIAGARNLARGRSDLAALLREEIVFARSIRLKMRDCSVLHGDLDASNLLFDGRGQFTIIDFDDATTGPPELDLGIALRNLALKPAWQRAHISPKEYLPRRDALLRGYGYAHAEQIEGWVRFAALRYLVLMMNQAMHIAGYPSNEAQNVAILLHARKLWAQFAEFPIVH